MSSQPEPLPQAQAGPRTAPEAGTYAPRPARAPPGEPSARSFIPSMFAEQLLRALAPRLMSINRDEQKQTLSLSRCLRVVPQLTSSSGRGAGLTWSQT